MTTATRLPAETPIPREVGGSSGVMLADRPHRSPLPMIHPARRDETEAGTDTQTWTLRPCAEQAERMPPYLPRWLAQVRHRRPRKVIIDLSRARRLDFTAFGVLLAKLRDWDIPVMIVGAATYLAETLHQLALLAGATVMPAPGR
jgi:hypothetical protein